MKKVAWVVLAVLYLLMLWEVSSWASTQICNMTTHQWVTESDGCGGDNRYWTKHSTIVDSSGAASAALDAAGAYDCSVGGAGTGYPHISYYYGNECTGPGDCSALGDGYIVYWHDEYYDEGDCVQDSDEDGIPDEYDPYPNDATSFKWGKVVEVRDENGVLKAIIIRTDRGDSFVLGNRTYADACFEGNNDCQQTVFVSAGADYPNDGSALVALLEGVSGSSFNPSGSSEVLITPQVDLSAGVMSDPGDTDSETMKGIQDNTARIADNQGELQQTLGAILATGQKILAKPDAVGGGASASSIGSAVSSSEGDREDAAGAALTNDLGSVPSDISSINPDVTAYGDDDKPEKSLLSDVWDSFISGSGMGTLFSGSGVSTGSPVCSVSSSVSILGQSSEIAFSFCDYESQLESLGVLVLGIAGIFGLVILVRG